ncbi:MAG: hypothetical protein PVSMB2_36370 [Ktedonobacteraceae bacterium]
MALKSHVLRCFYLNYSLIKEIQMVFFYFLSIIRGMQEGKVGFNAYFGSRSSL